MSTRNSHVTSVYLCLLSAEINECVEETDNCSQLCINTIGAFTCDCLPGYALSKDGATCSGMYSTYIAYVLLSYTSEAVNYRFQWGSHMMHVQL